MSKTTTYEDHCVITCTDNDKTMKADILEFREGQFCTVSINRAVKIQLHFDQWSKKYIGRSAGLEFITEGPKGYETRQGVRG